MSKSNHYATKLLTTTVEELVRRVGEAHNLVFEVTKAPCFGYHSTMLFVEAGTVRYVLKVLDPVEYGPQKIRSSVQIQQALSRNGVPVALPLSGEDGQPFSIVDDNICVLFPEATDSGFEPGCQSQLVAAGETLAAIHSVDPGDLFLGSTSIDDVVESCVTRARELHSPIDLNMDRLREFRFDGFQDFLLHGDFRAQNVLFSGCSVSCVLDWDDAVAGPRLLDLCYSLVFFQAVICSEAPTVGVMRAFLEGYERVHRLTPDEWDQMSDYLLLSLLKGLTLWATILKDARDARVQSRVRTWLETYAPLQENIPPIAARLRT